VELDEAHLRLWQLYSHGGESSLVGTAPKRWHNGGPVPEEPLGRILELIASLPTSDGERWWGDKSARWALLNTKRERNLLFLDDPKDRSACRHPMMFLAMASELHLLARSAQRALAEYNGDSAAAFVPEDWTAKELAGHLCSVLDACAAKYPAGDALAADAALGDAPRVPKRRRDGTAAGPAAVPSA
jgi:hypothetical protein